VISTYVLSLPFEQQYAIQMETEKAILAYFLKKGNNELQQGRIYDRDGDAHADNRTGGG